MIQTSDIMVPNLNPFVVNIPMASLDFFFHSIWIIRVSIINALYLAHT